ncbi:hypothetical protein ACLM5H_01250 [Fredinandcohnia humi]
MGFNPQNFNDSQQKLMNMFVENIFKKNGLRPNTRHLTHSQKREIRNTIEKLQKQTEEFLNNAQRKVTEEDVNPITNVVEDTTFTPNDARTTRRYKRGK